jgi:superfamily II DNA or RNA helicase
LVVNEELDEDDVRAVMEAGDCSPLEELFLKRLKTPREILEKQRLAMLAWLFKQGLLDIRVGVMRRGGGIVHGKFGITFDEAGDAVVFAGSGNESGQGLTANYERLEVSSSWKDVERHEEYTREFAALWNDKHPDVHTVTLPEAVRLKLIKFAPKEPPVLEPSNALERQKNAMIWQFITEAPYLPNGAGACDATAPVSLWPHQKHVVQEVASAWPSGRLLCDEVGMGKTIEAILALRQLMAGRGVRRVLVLLPAGLIKQWQGELREKGGLIFPRLENPTTLVFPDGREKKISGLAEALRSDVLLMSREAARTEGNLPLLLEAEPWDLVILDEAHAARRGKQEEGEFNNGTLLLNLVRKLQLKQKARGILLLSATPMQTHPWEPWDLLSILGEGGKWLSDFGDVRGFYGALSRLKNGMCDLGSARAAASMVAMDPAFPPIPEDLVDITGKSISDKVDSIANAIAFCPPGRRAEVERWLRLGSPLARRMHRNTRATLRQYYEQGLLDAPPPIRSIQDCIFDYEDSDERCIYDSIKKYIESRFEELEKEKPGKGFVMTIYRRRASSSPYALEQSLSRRLDGLNKAAAKMAGYAYLEPSEGIDTADLDDLGELSEKISAAYPADAKAAEQEIQNIREILDRLAALGNRDTKRDFFFDRLRDVTDDGRSVLVFTEYSDTMIYLRDALVSHYGLSLACYSGDGGQVYEESNWKTVTKDVITKRLADGKIRILLCTDAASEGLNLQAAGALINYDLPWNPSRVEQRIGRIDRIGQKQPVIHVVNIFLKDSVDMKVYQILRHRCGLFEHFVGAMQPVLAKARRMLIRQDPVDTGGLEGAAKTVEVDQVASETYFESAPSGGVEVHPPVTKEEIIEALSELDGRIGPKVKASDGGEKFELTGPDLPKSVFSAERRVLEKDFVVRPLSPSDDVLQQLARTLGRSGERLPLVIETYQKGPFRCSNSCWVEKGEIASIETMEDLKMRVESWDGTYPDPDEWVRAREMVRIEATRRLQAMEVSATERERAGLRSQIESARIRLKRELGRYLVSQGANVEDLNGFLFQVASKDSEGSKRLKKVLGVLDGPGGYPDWDDETRRELESFQNGLTDNQVRGRSMMKEIDAALQDPRWDVEA